MKAGYEDEAVTGKTPPQGGRSRQRSAPDVFDQFDVGDQLRAAPAGSRPDDEWESAFEQDAQDDWEQSSATRAPHGRRTAPDPQPETDDAWDDDEPPADTRGRGAHGTSQGNRSRPAPEPDEYDPAYDDEAYDDDAPQPARRDPAALVKRYLPYAFIALIVVFGVAMIGANVLSMLSGPPEPKAPRPTLALQQPAPSLAPPPVSPPAPSLPPQTTGGPAPSMLPQATMPQPIPAPQPAQPLLAATPLAPPVLVPSEPAAPTPSGVPAPAPAPALAPGVTPLAQIAPMQRPVPTMPGLGAPAPTAPLTSPTALPDSLQERQAEAVAAPLAAQANRLAAVEQQLTALSEATARTAVAPDRIQDLRQEVAGLRGSLQTTSSELTQLRLILQAERARIDAFDGRMKTMETAPAAIPTAVPANAQAPTPDKPAAVPPVRTTVRSAPSKAPVQHPGHPPARHKARETAKSKPEPQEARRAWTIRAAMPGVVWMRPKNEAGGDLMEVRVGQTLPGYGAVVDIRQQNGRWAAITEKGTIE